ncbi:GrpB family protein [Gallaecimonas sp. GXIMD4217]|uniref:GrpB family protein n=1 Tax=Gallaecimonas sp. GXIMD4217 TaxID=3131927 RepID=UPI00311B37F5
MQERKLVLVDYRPQWARAFAQEAEQLQAALGDVLLAAHHIGSTSVEGLAAKPVIDILLEVTELAALDSLGPAMAALGYRARGENGIPGRRYFQKGGNLRSHQLHAFVRGDEHVLRHLAFRDYLRAFPEKRDRYAALKREAVAACGHDIKAYQAYKHDFIQQHQGEALKWFTP